MVLLRPLLAPHARRIFLSANVVTCLGSLMAITAGFWDIMHHVQRLPESFFTAPHALLYSGVAVTLLGAVLMFLSWRMLDAPSRDSWRFPFRLGILGVFLLVISGPIDFSWHDAFGLDGLLSPPHQLLLLGMMLTAVGPMIAISRHGRGIPGGVRVGLVAFSLLSVWMTLAGLLHSHTLPFSNTGFFSFNPDVWFAVIIATLAMPFVSATVLLLSAHLTGFRFGVITGLGATLLALCASSLIVSNPALYSTIPFFFLTIVPYIMADILVSRYRSRRALAAAGAIIGSTFYFAFYPFVTYVYNGVIFHKLISGSVTFQVFFEQLPVVLPLVIGPAVVMGILGSALAGRLGRRILPPAWQKREAELQTRAS